MQILGFVNCLYCLSGFYRYLKTRVSIVPPLSYLWLKEVVNFNQLDCDQLIAERWHEIVPPFPNYHFLL
jgi:hypothetical protein